MADIAHTLPASVTVRDGSEFGYTRPGVDVTRFASGGRLTRDWCGHNLREYELDPSLMVSGADTLQEYETWRHQVGAGAGYIVEPISGTHRDLLCGMLADGSSTTFPVGVVSPSSVTVFVDGVPQESSAYTIHTAANLLDDDEASPADASDFATTNGTDSIVSGASLDGLSCVKVAPSGGSNPGTKPWDGATFTTAVSSSSEYTGIAAVRCTNASAQNYRVILQWFNSTPAYISTSAGSDVSVDASDGWTVISVTATSPGTAAYAMVYLERNDTSGTNPFYADCFAIVPGDYTRWHLPSQSPGLIEFGSAPASGARVTATATGQRVTRCYINVGTKWSLSSPGHAAVRSIRATEWAEI